MIRKTWIASVLAAVLMLTPMVAHAATDGTGTIDVTVTVDQFAEWGDAANNYSIAATDFDGHVNHVNQTRTAIRNLTLYSNVALTLSATAGAHSGILSDATNTYHLSTTYDITGATITTVPGPLAPAAFFNVANTYTMTHTAGVGSYTVTLTVTASSPAASAPEAGDYTCGLSLTATW